MTRTTTARYRCLVLTGGPREVYSKFEVEVGSRLFGVARALCEVAVLERGVLVSVWLGKGAQRGRMKEHHDRRGKQHSLYNCWYSTSSMYVSYTCANKLGLMETLVAS